LKSLFFTQPYNKNPLMKISKLLGLLGVFLTVMLQQGFAQTVLIGLSGVWKYYDAVTPANIPSLAGWQSNGFNDASWSSGPAKLGYGDGDEATVVSYGPNASTKYTSTYFRKTINITNPAAYTNFTFRYRRDDGIVIYVNGVEVRRDNMRNVKRILILLIVALIPGGLGAVVSNSRRKQAQKDLALHYASCRGGW